MLKRVLLLLLCAVALSLPAPAQMPGGPGYSPLMRGPADLFYTNVGPGVEVGGVFDVNGGTSPYNQIELTVFITNTPQVVWRQTFSADPNGYFGIRVDASRVPPHTMLTIQAQARDRQGNVGPVRTAEVLRVERDN